MTNPYLPETENLMKLFYENISEKDRRLYAAVEAQKIGHGGIQYIADLFDCSRQTIHTALDELKKKSSFQQNKYAEMELEDLRQEKNTKILMRYS